MEVAIDSTDLAKILFVVKSINIKTAFLVPSIANSEERNVPTVIEKFSLKILLDVKNEH